MATTTQRDRAIALGLLARDSDRSAGLCAAQNAFLSELPGIAFALVSLFYIVSSLAGLR